MERNQRPRRRRKRKREPEQTKASGEAGPPSKKSAPPPAPLEVICSKYSDTSRPEGLSQSQQEKPKEHPQKQSREAEPRADLEGVYRSPASRGKKKATPSDSKKSGPPTEQRAKKATPSSSKGWLRIQARTNRSPTKSGTNARWKRRHLERELEAISPHSFVHSRVNDIKNAPWIGKEEFAAVYTWLYSNKTELISKGVARVAAWNTRGKLPVGIDITAHLCEAFLMEIKHKAGNSYQAVSFGFSVAITRFVNGLVEAVLLRDHVQGISKAAMRFDIPQWVIDLRHQASHYDLPSAGRLRAGATFCLQWLKQYYWKQYEDIQLIQRPGSRSASPVPAGGAPPIPLFPPKPKERQPAVEDAAVATSIECTDGAIGRLTRGLCTTKVELVNLLASSAYTELAEYLRKKQLLQFPDHNTSYVLTTPESADLINFSELEIGSTDLSMWKKHLLKACEQNPCFKQTLISALIVVVNSNECEAGLRDYLCSWLCMLMVEQYQVDTEQGNRHGIEVVQILDDDEQFLPGTLDWLTLLKIAKKHAGYYTYAIVNVILQHLKSTLPESTRDHILYLTTLVTLSDRIGHDSYIPGIRRGTYELEFRQAKAKLLQSRRSEEGGGSLPPAKRAKLEKKGSKARWLTVDDMSQWVKCPLGLAPGQTEISSTMFDLPASLDGLPIADSMAITTTSMVLDDKSEYAEDEEGERDSGTNSNGANIFDATLIENIQNQVTIL